MGKQWHFEKYAVYEEGCDRTLRFEDAEGEILGFVVAGSNEDHEANMKALDNGADPIKERWEDGADNTVSLLGWGEYYLKAQYAAWRKASEEMIEAGIPGDVDCGYGENKEDFSYFAGLGYVIEFEDMLELERAYESEHR